MSEPRAPRREADTARQRLRELLTATPVSARELSQLAGLSEKDVLDHLAHLERSLETAGTPLAILPARCRACGFDFEPRIRRARPSRCPKCRAERIEAARFGLRS